ncbi:hypothetical protein GC173_08070 [bacterium]|nr:hypothetical protein [bacterium]
MTNFPYTIVIEPTEDPGFFGFFSPDLPGYTGCATSFNEAVIDAINGISEYIDFLRAEGIDVPPPNPAACIRLATSEDLQDQDDEASTPLPLILDWSATTDTREASTIHDADQPQPSAA